MADALRCLVKDVAGAEGPCVDRDGRVFFVGPDQGRVIEVLPDGSLHDHARTEGIPAGLQVDRENHLWVADMKRGILWLSSDGEVHEEVVSFDGAPIRGCNDLCFDGHGHLYFTAPAGSNEETHVGELFCRLADGEVRRLDDGFAFCNGLAVTADDKTLIVAETFTKRLYAYDVSEPGMAANKRVFATLPGDRRGGADGMDFDAEGNLLVAYWGGGGIEIYRPDGRVAGRIETPFEKVSNVHFRGPGSRALLITEHDTNGLWETEHTCPGQAQYGWG